VENGDFPLKLGAGINGNKGRRISCIRIPLIVEKTPKKLWKIGHLQLCRSSGQIPF